MGTKSYALVVNGIEVDARTPATMSSPHGDDQYLKERCKALAEWAQDNLGWDGNAGAATAAKMILERHLPEYESCYMPYYTANQARKVAREAMLARLHQHELELKEQVE